MCGGVKSHVAAKAAGPECDYIWKRRCSEKRLWTGALLVCCAVRDHLY